jgi:hypothetical protein
VTAFGTRKSINARSDLFGERHPLACDTRSLAFLWHCGSSPTSVGGSGPSGTCSRHSRSVANAIQGLHRAGANGVDSSKHERASRLEWRGDGWPSRQVMASGAATLLSLPIGRNHPSSSYADGYPIPSRHRLYGAWWSRIQLTRVRRRTSQTE